MKRFSVSILSIIAVFTTCLLFMSMAKNNLDSVKGYINYYGNAPFVTPAFKTDEGKVYLMEVDKSSNLTMDQILSHQGEHLELTGEIEAEESELAFPVSQDGTIFVSSFRPVK